MILVGGQGTRLRPLTSTVPKPVVTLVDRPFISFMLEWLAGHGIDDVIMSCGFLADGVRSVLGDGSDFGVRLRFVEEPEPLGTAGAVKLAEPLLDETFLMLNGDVLTDIDLTAQIAQHRASGARATLALVAVADPSAYGLVDIDADNSVREFVEKPSADRIGTNLISAGAYVLQREILGLVEPGRKASIEREVWPALVGSGLYGFASEAYWLDIGTPDRYLQGSFDIISASVHTAVSALMGADGIALGQGTSSAGTLTGPLLAGERTSIAAGARVGPLVVLGRDVTIGEGALLERSVVLDGAVVGPGCELRDCIIAPAAHIGAGTSISGQSMLGEGASVGADNVIARGARIFPGVRLPDHAIEF